METDKLSDTGYRTQFEYYDKKEAEYKRLADEMHQKKMETLARWKKNGKLKEVENESNEFN